jgi:hypothetical protein
MTMTTPWLVEWFTVGGQRRISGWSMTAMDGRRLGICPVCFSLVPAGDAGGWLDLTRRHERWHANNDFPDHASITPTTREDPS